MPFIKYCERVLAKLGRVGRVATALGALLSALSLLPDAARDVKAAVQAVRKPAEE